MHFYMPNVCFWVYLTTNYWALDFPTSSGGGGISPHPGDKEGVTGRAEQIPWNVGLASVFSNDPSTQGGARVGLQS